MDDLDLHLALEALRTNPAAHVYHERTTRGMQAIEQGTLTPFERDALLRLLERFPSTPPSPDPVAALIAAFQDKLPTYDPAAVATAIQHALAQRPATLNGAPVTITMNGDTHAHQANLAIGNQVGGNLVQVTVTIPMPDARFDALLASAIRTHEHEKTLARIQHAAQQSESDRLLNLRLKGFIGRVNELAEIREHIETMRSTGGYVLIKAAAGEGKSSSIAKLIQEAGIATTPHHFIDLIPDPKYQLGLLRTVVAQLILRHGLTVSYFPQESYHAMKAEFARILNELSKQGIQETIYLDGLDQLKPEDDGLIDLSFLPPQPPPGIVIVLGSRPDETLKPLNIVHRVDYDLPPLNEADALMLWRSVQPSVAHSLLHDLYTALKGNALFVHLAADTMQGASLSDATSLIKQIEQNPSNLFGITLARIKGRSLADWRAIWKPMLALLLVAQEPLPLDVLGDLLGHDHDTMQDAVWVLGGLVSQGIDQRVALHHLLFRDYLAASVFNQREVKCWHQRLADWCAKDLDTIWADDRDPIEQARRMYARHHYVTHLALAENWPMLWQTLDTGDYGEQKTRFDPSTRLYALDLDRGRESAINAGQSAEEHIQNLPRLWKYSLLRTSLTSRVDQWPDELFEVLAMFGKTQEVLERIELLSDPRKQIRLWKKLIAWCNYDQAMTIFIRMQYFPVIDPVALIFTAIKVGDFDYALRHMNSLGNARMRASALATIADGVVRNGNITLATQLISQTIAILHSVSDIQKRVTVITALIPTALTLGDRTTAATLIDQARTLTQAIPHDQQRAELLYVIAQAAIAAGDRTTAATLIDQARTLTQAIPHDQQRAELLCAIAQAAVAAGDYATAAALIDQARTLLRSNIASLTRLKMLAIIAQTAIAAGDHATAASLINQAIASPSTPRRNIEALISIMLLIPNAAQSVKETDYPIHLIKNAAPLIRNILSNQRQPHVFAAILRMVLTAGEINHALRLIDLAETIAKSFPHDQGRTKALATIATTTSIIAITIPDHGDLLFERAIILAQSIPIDHRRVETLAAITLTATIASMTILVQNISNTFNHVASIIADVKAKDASTKDSTRYLEDLLAILDQVTTNGYKKSYFFDETTMISYDREDRQRIEALVSIAKDAAATKGRNITPSVKYENRIEAFAAIMQEMVTSKKHSHNTTLFSEATTLAQSVRYSWSRTKTFVYIVMAMNNNHKNTDILSNHSNAIIEFINIASHPEFLTTLAIIATSKGNSSHAIMLINEAISMAHSIQEDWQRIEAFTAIAQATLAMGNSNQTLEIVRFIMDTKTRVYILNDIFKISPSNEQIMYLTQMEWNASRTHHDSWTLLPLVISLVKDYPWLGTAILEEEGWVNAQLKRLG